MFHFNIKILSGDNESYVRELYSDHGTFHSGDSGLDLFCPQTTVIPARAVGFKIPLGISSSCQCKDTPQSYWLLPRSSTGSKTPLRLSNSMGLIDQGYRGELIAMVDNISDEPFAVNAGERYFQLAAPTLGAVSMSLVEDLGETSRGTGGFGSTGN